MSNRHVRVGAASPDRHLTVAGIVSATEGRAEGRDLDPARGGDVFVGVVFGVLASSNLVQGAWIEELPWLNITMASFALAPLIALTGIRRRLPISGMLALLVLLASLAAGFLEPPAGETGTGKRINILLGVALVSVASFLALTSGRRLKAFFATLVVLGLTAVAAQWLNPDPAALLTGRRTPEGLNAIGAARLMGAGLVVTVGWGLGGARRHLGLVALVCMPLVIGLIAAASRGPLLGTGIALLAVFLLHSSLRLRTKLVIMSVAVPVVYLVVSRLLESASRLIEVSSTGRRLLYEIAVGISVEHPVGVGWGNFYRYVPAALRDSGQGENLYVHNVILEFLVEAGLVGAILFVTFLVCVSRRAWLTADSVTGLALVGLAVGLFVGALLSSDVVGNRMLWVVCGAILAGTAHHYPLDPRPSFPARSAATAPRGWPEAGTVRGRPTPGTEAALPGPRAR